MLNDIPKKEAWLRERDRRESEKSLFYFAKFIAGYDLEREPHRELCDFVQGCYDDGANGLVLMPRGSYKTSIISQAFPIWVAMLKDANARILLDSEILSNSRWNLDVISNLLKRNQPLRAIWGDLVNPEKWNQDAITLRTRTSLTLKEPTVGTASLDSVEIGPHWSLIILDDPHSADNVQTKEQIDLVERHFRLLFPLRHNHGGNRYSPIIVVGTRWTDLDLYGRILDNQYGEFRTHIRGAHLAGGRLLFPSVLTEEKLADAKKRLGSDLYSCQYDNDPLPAGESQPFKPENFRYRDECRAEKVFILVDPAISESVTACDTAVVIAGITPSNEFDVVDYLHGRWHPHVAMEKLAGLVARWGEKVAAVAIETNAYQKLFKYDFQLLMQAKGRFPRIIELNHTKSKNERILALQPRYEYHAIYHRPHMKDGELEQQLKKFPRGRARDIIDALASILEVCKPKRQKAPEKPQEELTADELIRRQIDKHLEDASRKEGLPHCMGTGW